MGDATRIQGQRAFRGEPQQRFAHGRGADVELGGDGPVDQPLPRAQPTAHQSLAQRAVDLRRQALVTIDRRNGRSACATSNLASTLASGSHRRGRLRH